MGVDLFGFVVGAVCVVIVPYGPVSKEVSEVFLETKPRRFGDVDTNKFHFRSLSNIHCFRNDSVTGELSQF